MNFIQQRTPFYAAPAIDCLEIEVEKGFAATDATANVLPGFSTDADAANGNWFQPDEEY